MRSATLFLSSALACSGLAACATYDQNQPDASASDTETVLSGNLVYRERIALRPGSTAKVSLEDVSLADAPSRTIASRTIPLDGQQVPITFTLGLETDELSSRGRYSLRATIHGPDGRLAWTTDTAHLFDPTAGSRDFGNVTLVQVRDDGDGDGDGDGNRANQNKIAYTCGNTRLAVTYADGGATVRLDDRSVALERVPSGSGAKYENAVVGENDYVLFWQQGDNAQLRIGDRDYPECTREMIVNGALEFGREWVVEDIDTRGIIDSSRVTIRFSADGRISGRASCNNYTGSYRLEGQRLVVPDTLAVTRKLCAPALMNQEERFLATLTQTLEVSRDENGALSLSNNDEHSLRAR